MKKIKNITFSIFAVTLIILYILHSDIILKNVSTSVKSCLEVIIPSMYGFMIISSFLISSGIYRFLAIPLKPVAKYIFGIPQELFSIFLISCIAGYPVGIKMIYQLYEDNKISKSTADYMSCFCFCSGFAFILGTVSSKLFSDSKIGFIIFSSIVIGNILTAILMRVILNYREKSEFKKQSEISVSAKILTDSVKSSAESMFLICAMIVGFSVIISMIENFNFGNETIKKILFSFFEISKISDLPKENFSLIPIITSLLSFGGICVFIQIIALTNGKLNSLLFLFSRLISAILSGIVCKFIIMKTDICISTASFTNYKLYNEEYSIIPSIALFIMSIILIKNSELIQNRNS